MKNALLILLFTMFVSMSFGGITEDGMVITSLHPGAKMVTVKGSSMVPMFRENDVLIVLPVQNKAELKKGMVCVYKNVLGELVVHTVTSTDPLKFKGMNNKKIDTDECVEILGVMYGIINNWENESVEKNTIVLAKKY